MKKHISFPGLIFSFLLSVFLGSCQSLQQDRLVSSLFQEELEKIFRIEKRFSVLEAENLLVPLKPDELNAKSLGIIKDIDDFLLDENLEKVSRAKLLSVKGKCLFLIDRKNAAKDCYHKTLSTYKGEVGGLVLGSRLGLISGDIEEKSISNDEKPFLTLEKAIDMYKKKNFRLSAAKFDEAFMKLDSSYRKIYGKVRDEAWSLKDVIKTDGESLKLKKEITVLQMMEITQAETNLLYNYTASKKNTEAELYGKLSKAGLTFSASENGKPKEELSKDETVTRIKCARFLWNLKNAVLWTHKDKLKYSRMFALENESPVKDVAKDSPDFDAVLGCVESELMDLPDGENFFPDKNISGVEFSNSVKKIK